MPGLTKKKRVSCETTFGGPGNHRQSVIKNPRPLFLDHFVFSSSGNLRPPESAGRPQISMPSTALKKNECFKSKGAGSRCRVSSKVPP